MHSAAYLRMYVFLRIHDDITIILHCNVVLLSLITLSFYCLVRFNVELLNYSTVSAGHTE